MKVETSRFGKLEVNDASIINMVKGLVGFEKQTQYCLIQHTPNTKFRWLQSTEDPTLAFVVVDPSDFFENYEIEIPDAEAEKLNLETAEDALVLLVVTISDGGRNATANLTAPVIINSKGLFGMQVILQDTEYSVKHPLIQKMESEANCREAVTVKAA